jgi:hypothetical protein
VDISQDEITKEISLIWNIDDVLSIRPDLTEKQASDILNNLKKNHDANDGINWGTIEIVADILFPIEEVLNVKTLDTECSV